MHQMGLAEPDTAIQEQRVEAVARRPLGDPARAGIGEFVGLADHERVEGEARVERQFRAVIHPLLDPVRSRRRAAGGRGQALGHPPNGGAMPPTRMSTLRTAGFSACHSVFSRSP